MRRSLNLLGLLLAMLVSMAIEPTADAQTSTKTPKPGLLKVMFQKGSEEQRLAALSEIESYYRSSPEWAEVLSSVIASNSRKAPIALSTLNAVRLFERLDDPRLRSRQVEYLASPHLPIVVAATEELAWRKFPEARESLKQIRERREFSQSYALRHLVTTSVAVYQDRQAVKDLIDIASQHEGQLRYLAVTKLEQLTSQNFGGFIDKWVEWFAQQPDDYVPSPAPGRSPNSTEAPKPIAWPTPVPKFFETPVFAKRVVFLLDSSGSMQSTVDNETRMDQVRSEFNRMLREMPSSSYFNVLAFNDRVIPRGSGLTEADAVNKADAARFVEQLNPEHKTATYEALIAALTHDPNLEAIYFLTDGKPTAGTIQVQPVIVSRITSLNATSRIAINSIGIDTTGEDLDFIKQLAEQNFGTSRVIR